MAHLHVLSTAFRRFVLLSLVLAATGSLAQNSVNMPYNTGQVTYTLNSGAGTAYFDFYDNGGPAGNYSNNSNPATSVVTFVAPAGREVQVTYTAFSVESGWDVVRVFDGLTTASPQIASGNGAPIVCPGGAGGWWGAAAPTNVAPNVVRSTGGSLTISFCTDSSVTPAGWAAVVAPATVSIGGTVTGLDPGDSIVLRNNGGDDLAVAANGPFTFATLINNGSAYSVTVATQAAGKTCVVTAGAGTATADVTDVVVTCTSIPPVPTLGEWAKLLMAALLAIAAWATMRRRPA
jgi:hypothetical protein